MVRHTGWGVSYVVSASRLYRLEAEGGHPAGFYAPLDIAACHPQAVIRKITGAETPEEAVENMLRQLRWLAQRMK